MHFHPLSFTVANYTPSGSISSFQINTMFELWMRGFWFFYSFYVAELILIHILGIFCLSWDIQELSVYMFFC